jgi:hypothetical protein
MKQERSSGCDNNLNDNESDGDIYGEEDDENESKTKLNITGKQLILEDEVKPHINTDEE